MLLHEIRDPLIQTQHITANLPMVQKPVQKLMFRISERQHQGQGVPAHVRQPLCPAVGTGHSSPDTARKDREELILKLAGVHANLVDCNLTPVAAVHRPVQYERGPQLVPIQSVPREQMVGIE